MDILQKLYQVLLHNPKEFDNIMLWSAFLLCFFGFHQSREITVPDASSYDPTVHLNFRNISIDNPNEPKIIRIQIKASKTDPLPPRCDHSRWED